MQGSVNDVVSRMQNARRDFNRTLCELGGVSPEIADRLTDLYLKKKWAKLSIGVGTINVKHGAFLDRDVIQRATAMLD